MSLRRHGSLPLVLNQMELMRLKTRANRERRQALAPVMLAGGHIANKFTAAGKVPLPRLAQSCQAAAPLVQLIIPWGNVWRDMSRCGDKAVSGWVKG